jgi:hypothetical protein
MTDLIAREGKPEHRLIHLRLLSTDVPDFPLRLPVSVTLSVDDGNLVLQVDKSDKRFELRVPEIHRILVDGWSDGHRTAIIEYKDPFEVVESFYLTLGSPDHYWIKAFAKLCREKLGIRIESEEVPF